MFSFAAQVQISFSSDFLKCSDQRPLPYCLSSRNLTRTLLWAKIMQLETTHVHVCVWFLKKPKMSANACNTVWKSANANSSWSAQSVVMQKKPKWHVSIVYWIEKHNVTVVSFKQDALFLCPIQDINLCAFHFFLLKACTSETDVYLKISLTYVMILLLLPYWVLVKLADNVVFIHFN